MLDLAKNIIKTVITILFNMFKKLRYEKYKTELIWTSKDLELLKNNNEKLLGLMEIRYYRRKN